MADRPIIFSAPMVQALLAGRKTQTRRVLKPQPDLRGRVDFGTILPGQRCVAYGTAVEVGTLSLPYAHGDRLWVREAHWFTDDGDCVPVAGNEEASEDERKRPSIHMPRWASRLTLHVSEVRVQRLQEISEADAKAEGVEGAFLPYPQGYWTFRPYFADLWNSIHGEGAWDANPWVAAISFTVERANVDEARRA